MFAQRNFGVEIVNALPAQLKGLKTQMQRHSFIN